MKQVFSHAKRDGIKAMDVDGFGMLPMLIVYASAGRNIQKEREGNGQPS